MSAAGDAERSPSVVPDAILSPEASRNGNSPSDGALSPAARKSVPPSGSAGEVAAREATALAAEGPDSDELTVPPVGDLDVLFFNELPSESWLAHELELRDPRFMLKMTDTVARRRARLAKYVAGVVAVSAALCVAALVKAAVPMADDPMPRSQPGALVVPAPGIAPDLSERGLDGRDSAADDGG